MQRIDQNTCYKSAMRLNTLDKKIKYRIARSKDNVFVLDDFADLSDKDQIGRVLRNLVREEKLIKIGYGLYAKARYSTIFNKVMPIKSIPSLAKEALEKIGIEPAPSTYDRLYNERKSTQVPTGRVIGVKDRVSRKISFDGWKMVFEYIP